MANHLIFLLHFAYLLNRNLLITAIFASALGESFELKRGLCSEDGWLVNTETMENVVTSPIEGLIIKSSIYFENYYSPSSPIFSNEGE